MYSSRGLSEIGGELVVAIDTRASLTSQGKTRSEALEHLDDAELVLFDRNLFETIIPAVAGGLASGFILFYFRQNSEK